MNASILLIILLFGLIAPAIGATKILQSSIPLWTDTVQTHRVGDHLVRIINNFQDDLPDDQSPFLEIELIKVPDRKLLDRLSINKVTVQLFGKKTVLDFRHSQMASIEDIKVINGIVHFNLFFASGAPAPTFNVDVACEVNANLATLPQPQCHEIKRRD